MSGHSELAFETAIEAGLTSAGGYEKRDATAYDEALALFPDDVTGFLQDSQPAKWGQLEALLGDKTRATVLDSLSKELEIKGTLHVLRYGFKCYGKTFRLAQHTTGNQHHTFVSHPKTIGSVLVVVYTNVCPFGQYAVAVNNRFAHDAVTTNHHIGQHNRVSYVRVTVDAHI